MTSHTPSLIERLEPVTTGDAGRTAGPWVAVHGILPPDDEGHPRSIIRPVHSEGYQIAQTVGPHGEAHANLLAAAPDLLKALEAIRDGLADTGSGRSRGERMTQITKADAYEIAVAALSSAKGSAQP